MCVCVYVCPRMCALACMCEHLSICACLGDMMCMMCGSEAYLPPSYIICILVTACPLAVRFTDAYSVPLAVRAPPPWDCYGGVHAWVSLLWQTDIMHTWGEWEVCNCVYVCVWVCTHAPLGPAEARYTVCHFMLYRCICLSADITHSTKKTQQYCPWLDWEWPLLTGRPQFPLHDSLHWRKTTNLQESNKKENCTCLSLRVGSLKVCMSVLWQKKATTQLKIFQGSVTAWMAFKVFE